VIQQRLLVGERELLDEPQAANESAAPKRPHGIMWLAIEENVVCRDAKRPSDFYDLLDGEPTNAALHFRNGRLMSLDHSGELALRQASLLPKRAKALAYFFL
jgi:hypothetical protein